jgi:hypothetical protein
VSQISRVSKISTEGKIELTARLTMSRREQRLM